jgi:ADP-heptose:LPS heptosyltransferase
MKILIFPYAKQLRNGATNPKNYPWWPEVITALQTLGHTVIQAGSDGELQLVPDFRRNLNLNELAELVKSCDTWISVDSFAQHFCWDLGVKGIVLFGQSDPNIFGHPENINLLKSRDYLRPHQFWLWEQAEYIPGSFVDSEQVVQTIRNNFC